MAWCSRRRLATRSRAWTEERIDRAAQDVQASPGLHGKAYGRRSAHDAVEQKKDYEESATATMQDSHRPRSSRIIHERRQRRRRVVRVTKVTGRRGVQSARLRIRREFGSSPITLTGGRTKAELDAQMQEGFRQASGLGKSQHTQASQVDVVYTQYLAKGVVLPEYEPAIDHPSSPDLVTLPSCSSFCRCCTRPRAAAGTTASGS